MSSVKIRNLRKSFGSIEVVHGVSLDISDGEFLILVGPSGCGKSTLLRMIAGLENITSGDVIVDDVIINKLPPRERNIAMVFQSYALNPHMTVRNNMAFSLKLAGRDKNEIAEKVAIAAEVLDLQTLLDRKPARLSGGQRQRVAMGRAIVRNPKLFLFDEPLSNLDAKLRVQMRAEIKEMHQRLQTTIIYVTHDQVEAMTMADRIVVMSEGSIEQVGLPMELYYRPQTLFVASFIGSPAMNVVEGTLSPSEQFRSSRGPEITFGDTAPNVVSEESIVLGIRPENINSDGQGILIGDCRIRVVEPMGSETLLSTSVSDETIVFLDRNRQAFSVGDNRQLFADPADFHFFERSSGARLSRSQM